MIKKLRRKFILINMALVSLVLLIVFGSLCFSNYTRLRDETRNAMRMFVQRDFGMPPPKMEIGNKFQKGHIPMLPVFCVVLGEDDTVQSTYGEYVEVSDEVLSQAVEAALESGQNEGVISKLGLRFLFVEQTWQKGIWQGEARIAFADLSKERSSMNSLLVSSLLVGAGGLAGFFLISLFLSGWALRPVEKAWEQQRQFVADASHELKTPLTVILADLDILLAHREDPISKQIKWVDYMKAEADRMKKLVDDLLFLAKSDSSRLPMVQADFHFSDMVWSCLLPFEPIAFEQGLSLDCRIEPDLHLIGDESQLRQLVMILLDNACKYAGPPPGEASGGSIFLSLERRQDKLVLSVRNTGSPIAEEHLPHLFERFYRADKSRSQARGGYGLGLAIAVGIVENSRGKIAVESSAQAGTTFTVTLPCRSHTAGDREKKKESGGLLGTVKAHKRFKSGNDTNHPQ